MEFRFTKKHLKLKFSFKELILIILRGGNFILDRRSCYEFMTILQGIITKAIGMYGDGREHGVVENKDTIEDDDPLK
tara:strand:+ start:431 stop:661 length:231 start_codon:yes stop_codon:yes gene_type:complete